MKKKDVDVQRWGDDDSQEAEAVMPIVKPSVEINLHNQPDAPHVFRFECPECKTQMSLFGRMGSWFIKTLR